MDYTRSFPLEDISVRSGGDGRTVEAYAAIFNTPTPVHDQDGEYSETIDPVAFNRAIEHAKRAKGGWNIPVMFNHGMTIFHTPSDRHSVPIGVVDDIRPDARGLFTRARYHKTPAADEVLEAVLDGSITSYSFSGAFRRSDPPVPRGGFRPDRSGELPTVRRMESTLREFGPATFPVYAGAEIIGVRAEQVALLLSHLAPGELDRLATLITSGTHLDPPEAGTPNYTINQYIASDVDPAEVGHEIVKALGPATEDPPEGHSARSPHQQIRARYAEFIRTRSAQ